MSLYKNFIQKFEKAVISAKRDKSEIEVIAVSKKKSVADIKKILDLNHVSFGENQIQEIEKKWAGELSGLYSNYKLHFVGGIQSRKAKLIHQHCNTVHSLDRTKLVKTFDNIEKITQLKRQYFIQVNTGNEAQKSGVLLSESEEFIANCINNYNLNITGLMCLPPANENPKSHFLTLKSIASNFNLSNLSMGMTDDYEIAIQCGSTHIRIGREIFGERD